MELLRGALRDAVFGMEDGVVSTLGALTGIAAGTGDGRLTALAGVVVVAVESVSMAAGSFLSAKSERQLLEGLLREEELRIETDPEGERREIREMYGARGWTPEEIAVVEKRLMSDKRLLLEDMAHKELGLVPDRLGRPGGGALSMGLSYLLGGGLVVLPYFALPIAAAQPVSASLAASALFALGAAKGRLVGKPWAWSGLEMLAVGAAAAAVGWAVGRLAADRPARFSAQSPLSGLPFFY